MGEVLVNTRRSRRGSFDLIAARRHAHHALRRSGGARVEIGAQVGDHFDFQAQHRAVFLERQLRSHGLITALNRGDEILAARGDPLDRPAQLERQMTGQHILAIQRPLAAEAAADIGRDEVNLVLGKTQRVAMSPRTRCGA